LHALQGPQEVVADGNEQAAVMHVPAQLVPSPLQAPAGSVPSAAAMQVPSMPGTLQVAPQVPAQAVWQQTPCAQ